MTHSDTLAMGKCYHCIVYNNFSSFDLLFIGFLCTCICLFIYEVVNKIYNTTVVLSFV